MLSKFKALFASKSLRAQALRFGRLFAATLGASGIVASLVHGTATRASIIAAVVGAVEVAFRQVVPSKIGTPIGTVNVTTIVGDVERVAAQVVAHLHKQARTQGVPVATVTPPQLPTPLPAAPAVPPAA